MLIGLEHSHNWRGMTSGEGKKMRASARSPTSVIVIVLSCDSARVRDSVIVCTLALT